MARLNDPPVPVTESIDALKRRFIRQNREIARVNSTQSQRIRNLEIEISRLLAENIALREQAIAAAAEATKWRTANRLSKDVLYLKSKLSSKLEEVNALVEELGELPEQATRRNNARQRKSGVIQESPDSPNERDWRKRQTLGGVLSGEREGQDGRLPAILEDKYYPRRTLETEELRILTAAAGIDNEDTESPDLGPPPVAHFDVPDPIAFDSAKSPKRVSGGIVTSNEQDNMVLLLKNLETRKKRRTSSLLQEMPNLLDEAQEPSLEDSHAAAPLFKSSAKRKFDASEMEAISSQVSREDDFEFVRKEPITVNRPRASRFAARPESKQPENQSTAQTLSPQKQIQSRKALQPMSTNSPNKRTLGETTGKKNRAVGETLTKSKSTVDQDAVRISRIEPPQGKKQVEEHAYAPKTPAPPLEDMFSPPSSAMDTIPRGKSTEAAITNSVEDVLNGSIGRGSRRAKAAVSYALPNLRDKMRRPDEKLVGALEGINKPGSMSDKKSAKELPRDGSIDDVHGNDSRRVVKIKSDKQFNDEEEIGWKRLPEAEGNVKEDAASPLQDKRAGILKTSDIRKKRTLSESEGTKASRTMNLNTAEHDLDKAVSRLSIYDQPTSSPVSMNTEDKDASAIAVPKPMARPSRTSSATTAKSRRHSVQLSSDPNSCINVDTSASTNRPPSRPNSAMSARDAIGNGKENVNHSTAAAKLKRASSVQTLTQPSGTSLSKAPTSTVERGLGSRRRSMMV